MYIYIYIYSYRRVGESGGWDGVMGGGKGCQSLGLGWGGWEMVTRGTKRRVSSSIIVVMCYSARLTYAVHNHRRT